MKKRQVKWPPIPRGLPPVYHPFEGRGTVCTYCELPASVHLLREAPLYSDRPTRTIDR